MALADIAEQLRSLRALAGDQADLDPAKMHLLLLALAERFTGLADNAQAFTARGRGPPGGGRCGARPAR